MYLFLLLFHLRLAVIVYGWTSISNTTRLLPIVASRHLQGPHQNKLQTAKVR
ncbi:hypothetical protein GBAR_LOCUS25580 [Geodia barretti]|uniref:Uncharacterized protein n=1 Tax=Geodia barretti TaxID=519541 RepID=A0AA35TDF9_GEOBA|nr:hypothetical protein GBAR_LOCUS25580 [Geodia barretti]CAI8046281.1 hypothetical protein GBAR_LOCUS25580 [Geodia barretti]